MSSQILLSSSISFSHDAASLSTPHTFDILTSLHQWGKHSFDFYCLPSSISRCKSSLFRHFSPRIKDIGVLAVYSIFLIFTTSTCSRILYHPFTPPLLSPFPFLFYSISFSRCLFNVPPSPLIFLNISPPSISCISFAQPPFSFFHATPIFRTDLTLTYRA